MRRAGRDAWAAGGRAERRLVPLSRARRGEWPRAAFASAARIGLPCNALEGTVTIRSLGSTLAGGLRGEIRRAATGALDARLDRGVVRPGRTARSPISLASGRRFFMIRV